MYQMVGHMKQKKVQNMQSDNGNASGYIYRRVVTDYTAQYFTIDALFM